VSARADAATIDSTGRESPRARLNARAVALLLIALAVMLLAIAPLRGYLAEPGVAAHDRPPERRHVPGAHGAGVSGHGQAG
jgi:hypothetical protein